MQAERVCRFVYNPRELGAAAAQSIKKVVSRFITILAIYFAIVALSVFLATFCLDAGAPLFIYESTPQGDSIAEVVFPFTLSVLNGLNSSPLAAYKAASIFVIFFFEAAVCALLLICLVAELIIDYLTPDLFSAISYAFLALNTLLSTVVVSPLLGVIFICVKFLLIFGYIVLVRTTTPRFKLETITKLGWLYVLIFLAAVFIVYLLGFFLF